MPRKKSSQMLNSESSPNGSKYPFEATRGGRETTYPEYQPTLKRLVNSLKKGSE